MAKVKKYDFVAASRSNGETSFIRGDVYGISKAHASDQVYNNECGIVNVTLVESEPTQVDKMNSPYWKEDLDDTAIL